MTEVGRESKRRGIRRARWGAVSPGVRRAGSQWPAQSCPVQPGAGGGRVGRWKTWAVASEDMFSVCAHLS